MMATKPKPSGVSEEKPAPPLAEPPTLTKEEEKEITIPETTQEREVALKERLAALGHVDDKEAEKAVVEEVQPEVVKEAAPVADLLHMEEVANPKEEKPAPPSKLEKKAPAKDNKTALLARIMAAQERAKQAQQKKQASAVAEVPLPTTQIDDGISKNNAKQKMLEALSNPKPKEEKINVMNSFDPMAATAAAPPIMAPPTYHPPSATVQAPPAFQPPPAFEAPPAFQPPPTFQPPPQTSTMETFPPSFDTIGVMGSKTSSNASFTAPPIPPPAASAPSAPMFEDPIMTRLDSSEHLNDVVPLAPMAMQQQQDLPPPSFADYEQQQQPGTGVPGFMQKLKDAGVEEEALDLEAMMGLDIDGQPMTPDEKRKMMEEQRAIMEQIQKEKQANDAAIAAVRAENFDDRANRGAPQRAPASVTSVARAAVMSETGEDTTPSEESDATRTVDIGGGQRVALQGQEKTKAAIASGTAILVQCMSCENWMQVTDTATLMFCPVCQVVSPVIKQSEVNTKDEAIQLMKDRQLAEQLQSMEYEENGNDRNRSRQSRSTQRTTANEEKKNTESISDWLYSFVGNKSTNTPTAHIGESQPLTGSGASFNERFASQKEKKSWWDSVSSVLTVGVPDQAKAAELKANKPPGAATPKSGGLQQVRTGQEEEQVDFVPEHETLLGANNSKRSLQPARVADASANPFSCVVDTVQSIGTTLTTRPITEDANGKVHGINASPLLAVPNIGRNQNNSSGVGGYQRVPSNPMSD